MQNILSHSFIKLGSSILTSDYGVLVLFYFLKITFVLGHQGSDFQSSFYTFSFHQDFLRNYAKNVTDKRQKKLSEPMGWSLIYSRNGQFDITERGGWY